MARRSVRLHTAPVRHLHTVWQRAAELCGIDLAWLEPAMSDRLGLAALLHDVGKALDPDETEPHGFVEARLLDSLGLDDIAPLVALHFGASLEAEARDMSDRDQWSINEPDLLAVLTFLDRTTSSDGEVVFVRTCHASPALGHTTRHSQK